MEAWGELHQQELLQDWERLQTAPPAHCSPEIGKSTMTHPIHRVTAFEIVAPYTLRVEFEDHSHQIIDFQPLLAGNLYSPLRDLKVFNQVQLDREVHTLVWTSRSSWT